MGSDQDKKLRSTVHRIFRSGSPGPPTRQLRIASSWRLNCLMGFRDFSGHPSNRRSLRKLQRSKLARAALVYFDRDMNQFLVFFEPFFVEHGRLWMVGDQ